MMVSQLDEVIGQPGGASMPQVEVDRLTINYEVQGRASRSC
jgi:hypothetical protein